jgi:hypothetical protein
VKNLAVARVDDFFDPGIAGYPRTALWCNYSAGCDITDRLGVAANLSMGNFSGNLQLPAGIEIDVTPPQIIDVGVYTQSSTYAPLGDGPYGDEGAWYTVGEIIDLWIDFDRDVSPASDDKPLRGRARSRRARIPSAASSAWAGGRRTRPSPTSSARPSSPTRR